MWTPYVSRLHRTAAWLILERRICFSRGMCWRLALLRIEAGTSTFVPDGYRKIHRVSVQLEGQVSDHRRLVPFRVVSLLGVVSFSPATRREPMQKGGRGAYTLAMRRALLQVHADRAFHTLPFPLQAATLLVINPTLPVAIEPLSSLRCTRSHTLGMLQHQ